MKIRFVETEPLRLTKQQMTAQRRAWLVRAHARNPRCHYCKNVTELKPRGYGMRAHDPLELWATVDHALATARGGGDGPDNWRLACRVCNLLKADQDEREFIAELEREGIREARR